jgi:hypothetical protein
MATFKKGTGGQQMAEVYRTYIPAAGHDWTLPFYDPLVRLLGGNSARAALVKQAALKAGEGVLEIGSGTGTLLAMIKRQHPDVTVTGLDRIREPWLVHVERLTRHRCRSDSIADSLTHSLIRLVPSIASSRVSCSTT